MQIASKKGCLMEKANILVLDENNNLDCELLGILNEFSFEVTVFNSFNQAIKSVCESPPQLILFDLNSVNKDSFEIITDFRKKSACKFLPFIIIGDEKSNFSACLKVKTTDCLIRPFSAKEFQLRINKLIKRAQMQKALSESLNAMEKEKINMLAELDKHKRASKEILFRELLFDKITGFPTTPTLLEKIRKILEGGKPIDIIYFSISKLKKVEEVFGWQTVDRVLEFVGKRLEELALENLTEQDILAIDRAAGDDFILFISSPENYFRKKEMPLRVFGKKIVENLKVAIIKKFGDELAFQFDFFLGISSIEFNAKVRLERLVYNSIKSAVSYAINQEQRILEETIDTLRTIIKEEKILTLYQPIIDMKTAKIIGFEANSRGILDGFYQQPQLLFDLADSSNTIWQLERVCRHIAIENAQNLPDGVLLFMNLDPAAASDPDLKRSDLFAKSFLEPSRIVLEITERSNIDNFLRFQKLIDEFKKIGFKIAIDDAGSGYASLQSITELSPSYIKFDMALVRDINTVFIKQSMVEVLVKFATKMNIPVIAEGVETVEEYETLVKLNVPLGQGYLFSKPFRSFSEGEHAVAQFRKEVGKYDKT